MSTLSATSTGYVDDKLWQRLMFEWYGLTPRRGATWWTWACPHRLVGSRRCPYQCFGQWPGNHGVGLTFWDHARAWYDSAGSPVITLEPYGDPFHEGGAYARLIAGLDELGIKATFQGWSPYGASYMLMLTSRESAS